MREYSPGLKPNKEFEVNLHVTSIEKGKPSRPDYEDEAMTNLTDEGLRGMTRELCLKMEHEHDSIYFNQSDFNYILHALQQVRDAAKKERDEKITTAFAEGERIGIERVRVLAWDLIKNDKLDTAIRQME